MNKAVTSFVVFCLEAYRRAEHIDGAEAVDQFIKFDVPEYLSAGYDVLLSLGELALVQDISDFISARSA